MDEDNIGLIQIEKLEKFTKDFLKGTQFEGQENSSFNDRHESVFAMLLQSETGFYDQEALGRFMRELIKSQI